MPAAGEQPADVALVLQGTPNGRAQPQAQTRLAVAGVLFDGRAVDADRYTVREILSRGFSPLVLRYFALTAHYRAPWSFSWTGLEAAQCALEALQAKARTLAEAEAPLGEPSAPAQALREQFANGLADDLDTPAALEVVWSSVHSDLPPGERRALLVAFDELLDLGLATAAAPPTEELPAGAQALIDERAEARRARDWARSDDLRSQLDALGVETQDSPQGSTYRRRAPSS
jgi:cysteinyl-tRNA synthetase